MQRRRRSNLGNAVCCINTTNVIRKPAIIFFANISALRFSLISFIVLMTSCFTLVSSIESSTTSTIAVAEELSIVDDSQLSTLRRKLQHSLSIDVTINRSNHSQKNLRENHLKGFKISKQQQQGQQQHVENMNMTNFKETEQVSASQLAQNKIWSSIPMPSMSYFAGFSAPMDQAKWKVAQLQASNGEPILLKKILTQLSSSEDLFSMDRSFKWTHKLADALYSKSTGYFKGLDTLKVRDFNFTHNSTEMLTLTNRAPIILLGRRKYPKPDFEGHSDAWETLNPNEILDLGRKRNSPYKFPRKVVAMGLFDENWGWLSTYFLNRTVTWGMSFEESAGMNPQDKNFRYGKDIMKDFIDDENLLMLVVNSHHNFTHPKVISAPLGLPHARTLNLWRAMTNAAKISTKKDPTLLMNTKGSNYAFRPAIRECVAANMIEMQIKDNSNSTSAKISSGMEEQIPGHHYIDKNIASYASLCTPGLGADTYRLWETLASGTMPVLERGFGLDRTLYRLPVLFVDDFAEVTPFMIRQAYIEALYLVDQWEYKRMTKAHWINLIRNVSQTNSIQPLLDAHPMSAVDINFTRPLIPFDCGRNGIECGKGTKRTPKKSCAIDFEKLKGKSYNWFWKHEIMKQR